MSVEKNTNIFSKPVRKKTTTMQASIEGLTIQRSMICLTTEGRLTFKLLKTLICESYNFLIAVRQGVINDPDPGVSHSPNPLNIFEQYEWTENKIKTAFYKAYEIFGIELRDAGIKDDKEKKEPAPLKELWSVFQYIYVSHISHQAQIEVLGGLLIITFRYSPTTWPDKKMSFEISLPLLSEGY